MILFIYPLPKFLTGPNSKNLQMTNVTKKLKFVLGKVENIVGKGENAGYQHFLLLLQRFQKASFAGPLKVRTVW